MKNEMGLASAFQLASDPTGLFFSKTLFFTSVLPWKVCFFMIARTRWRLELYMMFLICILYYSVC